MLPSRFGERKTPEVKRPRQHVTCRVHADHVTRLPMSLCSSGRGVSVRRVCCKHPVAPRNPLALYCAGGSHRTRPTLGAGQAPRPVCRLLAGRVSRCLFFYKRDKVSRDNSLSFSLPLPAEPRGGTIPCAHCTLMPKAHGWEAAAPIQARGPRSGRDNCSGQRGTRSALSSHTRPHPPVSSALCGRPTPPGIPH